MCRKTLADSRPRVRGRFARNDDSAAVMPHETKKALAEKARKEKKANGTPLPSITEVSLIIVQQVKWHLHRFHIISPFSAGVSHKISESNLCILFFRTV